VGDFDMAKELGEKELYLLKKNSNWAKY